MNDDLLLQMRLNCCARLVRARAAVTRCFGVDFSPSPGLNMMVDLYLALCQGRDLYLWSLSLASDIPVSTAHRRIADLERLGLVWRETEAHDRRRICVKLTDQGVRQMEELLDRLHSEWTCVPDP